MQMSLLVMSMLLAIGGPPPGGEESGRPVTQAAGGPVISHCLVSLIDEVQIPGREPGALARLEAKEGMQVQANMLLGNIDDTEPAMQKKIKAVEAESAKEQADNDINVRYAKAATDVANAEYLKAMEANRKVPKSIPEVEINRLRLNHHKSQLQIEQARLEQRVAMYTSEGKGAEVDAAELSIQRRQLRAPFDGVVTNVYRHVGEWVAPGDPVLKLVRLDHLRIEGFLNVTEYNPHEIEGRPVTIEVELAHRTVKFQGKIAFVSPHVQAGGEYRVFAEVTNRQESGQYVLRPGLFATMAIHLK